MATIINDAIRVRPHSNSVNGVVTESTLPLTYFDTFWIKFNPVERLFLYRVTDITHQIFNTQVLPKLKHSLSHTLLHYLPLTGKIKWPKEDPKPSIFYSSTDDGDGEDGVYLSVAESNANFDTLSSYDIHEAKHLLGLTPELITSHDFAELISIQITLFPNRGFSIGVSTHHAIFDGKSSTSFVKAWAYVTKSQHPNLPPELTPSFDRTVIDNPTDSLTESSFVVTDKNKKLSGSRSLKIFPSLQTEADQTAVRATFVISRDDLNKLRNKIREYAVKESKEIHLSTFVVSYGYVISCMVKAKGGDGEREMIFGFPVDYRARLEPPVASNYFGNCVMMEGVCCGKTGEMMEENGVCVAVEKLSEAVKKLGMKKAIEGLEAVLALLKTVKPGTLIMGMAGSNRFGVYEIDFGWGRPEKVEVLSIHKNGIDDVSFAESRDGKGGVEFGVVLEKHEMEAFARWFHRGLGFEALSD